MVLPNVYSNTDLPMPQPDLAFLRNTERTIRNTYHPSNMDRCMPSFPLPFTIHGNFYLSCNSFFFLKVNIYTHSLQKYLLSPYPMPGLTLGTGDTRSGLHKAPLLADLATFSLFFMNVSSVQKSTSQRGCIWSRLIH